MKELLTYIVQSLVDNPDQVSVTERKADGETVYEVRVADGDMGKVIGRQGRIVNRSASLCGPSPRERAKKFRSRSWTDTIKPRCDCESSRGGVLLYPDAEHKALKSRRVNGIIKEIWHRNGGAQPC